MKRFAVRLLLFGALVVVVLPSRLPAPSGVMLGGSSGPAMPANVDQCKKALSDLDAEYVTRHLVLVKEIKARREAILTHCMSLPKPTTIR